MLAALLWRWDVWRKRCVSWCDGWGGFWISGLIWSVGADFWLLYSDRVGVLGLSERAAGVSFGCVDSFVLMVFWVWPLPSGVLDLV